MIFATVLAGLFVYWLYYEFYAKRKPFPPGPMPLPFIGNIELLTTHPMIVMTRLAKEYGPIYTVWFGPQPNVVICDLTMMKKYVSGKTAQAFEGRPPHYILEKFTGGEKYGLVVLEGPEWREQRRFSMQVLREFGFGRNIMEAKIMEEADILVKRIHREMEKVPEGEGFDPEFPFQDCSGSIIGQVTVGHGFEFDDPKFIQIKRMIDENLSLLQCPEALMIGSYPWLRHLPHFNKVWKLFEQHDAIYTEFLGKIVDDHVKELKLEDEATDYTAAYLKEMEKRKNREESMGFFGNFQLAITIGDIWVAAMETVATTLRWSVLFLVNRPEVYQRVMKELDEYYDDDTREATMNDKINLPYFSALICEVQRCGNIFPVNLQRRVTEDIHVEKYFLPKNTVVIPQIAAVHEDPDYFPNPEQFQPMRYLDENGKLGKKSEDIVPFSMGKRVCMGQSLAKMQIFLLLATLLRNFTFSVPSDASLPISEEPVLGFTRAPQKYKVVAKPRNR